MLLKHFFENQFKYFFFFYSYLKWRVFVSVLLSFFTGILDGLGLALFIPLLQIVFNPDENGVGQNHDFLNRIFFEELELEPELSKVFILIFILFSLKGVIRFLESYFRVVWQQNMIRNIRFKNLFLFSNFSYPAFVKIDPGQVQNTLGGDIAKISLAYRFYFKTVNFFVLLVSYFFLSLGVNWKFTLIVLLGGILFTSFFKLFYRRTKYLSKKLVLETNTYHTLLIENINLFKYLKSTGLVGRYVEKLRNSIKNMDGIQRNLGLLEALLFGIREPLMIVVIFSSIFLYSEFFDDEVSRVLLSLLLIYRAFSFFMASQEHWNLFLGNSGSIGNLRKFTNKLKQKQEKNQRGKAVHYFTNELRLENVSFRYDDNEDVLNNISLSVKKNSSVAIVGPSGAGKTTLMNILTGLLEPTEGYFFIDGKNFQDVNKEKYRKLLGYIVQDTTIFNDTIFNNISFWEEKSQSNLKRFWDAVKKANISNFISELPDKENTLLGMNGVNLSGGQKQRISLARELYKNAEILFLDEATSSLDTMTEREIQKNIENLKGDYTFIAIAHRINTIKNADCIILLDNGRITATGTYRELLESSSSFKKMVELQEL